MKNRVIAGAAALLVVVALVVVAVVAGGGGDSKEPKALPIGAGGDAAASRDGAMAMPIEGGGYGGIEYRIGKLPDLPDEADAYELPAAVADVDRIADALDVARKDVHAEKMGGGPWSVYLDEAVSSVASGVGYACPSVSDDSASNTTTTECAPPPDYEEPKRPEGMPTKDQARDIAEKVFDKLGVDLDGATVRVEDGFSQWMVSVDPRLDGTKVVGMTSTIGIGPHGKVVSANGWSSDPERGDTYPLITVETAAKRLQENQPRIMAGAAEDVAIAPDCLDCPKPEPLIVTVTGASLGLQLYGGYGADAPAYLVPTYLFTTDQPDSGELWQIAVEDKYLAPPPTVEPDPGVKPEPGGSGGAPTPEPAPDDPNATTVTKPSSSSGCNSTEADGVYVQVCGPTTARAGDAVQFQLIAKGRIRDDCGSPVPDYGDGDGVATCMIACESYPTEPRAIDRTYEHAYAKPGSYKASFTLMGCGSDGPQVSVSIEVRIE